MDRQLLKHTFQWCGLAQCKLNKEAEPAAPQTHFFQWCDLVRGKLSIEAGPAALQTHFTAGVILFGVSRLNIVKLDLQLLKHFPVVSSCSA